MIESPPISTSQCVLMNVSLLKYRVCNNQAFVCGDILYYDNITITVLSKVSNYVLFLKCL